MHTKLVIAGLALALAACGETADDAASPQESAAPVPAAIATPTQSGTPDATSPAVDASSVDFGDDSSMWANDGECDDSRFTGTGMTTTPMLDEDIGHDATDCRAAFARGDLSLR